MSNVWGRVWLVSAIREPAFYQFTEKKKKKIGFAWYKPDIHTHSELKEGGKRVEYTYIYLCTPIHVHAQWKELG